MMHIFKSCPGSGRDCGEQSVPAIFNEKFVTSVIPDAVVIGKIPSVIGQWVIDSRKVVLGAAFVALKGSVTDGHLFIADAITRGATVILMDHAQLSCLDELSAEVRGRVTFILVPSAEEAFIKFAAAWRAKFNIPVVGVTGSMGKTTTKELIASMIRLHGESCLVSSGNYNTPLGAAMTLMGLCTEHHCAVLEMGISQRGEMARLADLIRPNFGVITTIAHQHLDGLESLQGVAREKRAIFTHFGPDFIGIINGDIPLLSGVSYAHPVVRFGCKLTNQVQARRVSVDGARLTCVLRLYGERHQINLLTPHKGFLTCALASAAVAHFLGVPSSCIIEAIQTMAPINGRFNAVPSKRFVGCTVIDDAYNASPESLREALLTFERLDVPGKKIAVIGDMLGLGDQGAFWHRQIGRFLRKAPHVDHVILVGEQIRVVEKTMPRWVTYQMVTSWKEALVALECLFEKEVGTVLVKGSHDVGLHHLVTELIA